MKLFRCELIRDGIVIERFFREGESVQEITTGLEVFQWPESGEWTIEETER